MQPSHGSTAGASSIGIETLVVRVVGTVDEVLEVVNHVPGTVLSAQHGTHPRARTWLRGRARTMPSFSTGVRTRLGGSVLSLRWSGVQDGQCPPLHPDQEVRPEVRTVR